jgi:nitroimidazol reductase NimA-like FMN-containing flavoprotein (pyridoxamine 5'-phosphate oxidase superfamily)
MMRDLNGLELLDEQNCLALLASREMGRIGLSVAALPVVVPVLYQLIDRDIVIRTTPGSKLDAAWTGAVVAFEVDEFDAETRAGWSVLVRGPSRVLANPSDPSDASEAFVGIRCEMVSGRRVGPGSRLVNEGGWLGNMH